MEDSQTFRSFKVTYPLEWEEEYKQTRRIARWCDKYPALFRHALYGRGSRANYGMMSDSPGTTDLFAQYALQYLFAVDGVESLTMFSLPVKRPSPKNKCHIDYCRSKMRQLMKDDHDALRDALRAAGFKDFRGEPDLFCWDSKNNWYFAEAKGPRDNIQQNQRDWIDVYLKTLPGRPDIRVYWLLPEKNHMKIKAEGKDEFERKRNWELDVTQ